MSPGVRTGLGIAAVVALAGVTVLVVRGRGKIASADDDTDDGFDPGGDGMFENQDKVIAVGEANDPNVLQHLTEIRKIWRKKGVDLSIIDPTQFYVMSKATHADGPDPDEIPGPILAIASERTWDRTGDFVAEVLQPVLVAIMARGVKRSQMRIGGFREGHGSDGKGKGSYNTVVGGAKKSRHVDGDGADIIPTGGSGVGHKIKLSIARFKVDHPTWPIGFGAYAGNGHVDIGGDRDWDGETVPGEADKYMALARKEAAIS